MDTGRSRPSSRWAGSVSAGKTAVPTRSIPRVALTVDEACASLGVSRDHFERHIMGKLRIVYSGRRRLVPLKELEGWADREATIPGR